jgi:hypothetical protein
MRQYSKAKTGKHLHSTGTEVLDMLAVMSEKIRLVLLVDEEIQAALRHEAGRRTAARTDRKKVTMGEVLEELVKEGIPDAIEAVRDARAAEGKKGRGSKPKSE